jgi:hypothetical protein
MQHLQEPTVATPSTPPDAAEGCPKARVRRKALTGPITLEAQFSPATPSRGELIADALRLLAVWAVRVARGRDPAATKPEDST